VSAPGYDAAAFGAAFGAVGVTDGGCILVHSSLMHLGRLAGVAAAEQPAALACLLRGRLGAGGTLAVPAPWWDAVDRGVPFDVRRSPVTRSMGVLSQHVAALPEARRSPNPIFAVAAVGRLAGAICDDCGMTAFGTGSPWDRLHERDATIVFLGAPFGTMTLVRYIEHRVGVPYLYNKLLTVPILDDGRPLAPHAVAPLRYRHAPVRYDLARFEDALAARGHLRRAPLGGGEVLAVGARDAVAVGVDALKRDLYFFLAEPPPYVAGEPPLA
jgi:aminoglycoside N3'-acetyltransferase